MAIERFLNRHGVPQSQLLDVDFRDGPSGPAAAPFSAGPSLRLEAAAAMGFPEEKLTLEKGRLPRQTRDFIFTVVDVQNLAKSDFRGSIVIGENKYDLTYSESFKTLKVYFEGGAAEFENFRLIVKRSDKSGTLSVPRAEWSSLQDYKAKAAGENLKVDSAIAAPAKALSRELAVIDFYLDGWRNDELAVTYLARELAALHTRDPLAQIVLKGGDKGVIQSVWAVMNNLYPDQNYVHTTEADLPPAYRDTLNRAAIVSEKTDLSLLKPGQKVLPLGSLQGENTLHHLRPVLALALFEAKIELSLANPLFTDKFVSAYETLFGQPISDKQAFLDAITLALGREVFKYLIRPIPLNPYLQGARLAIKMAAQAA